jgi:hypothetical protein
MKNNIPEVGDKVVIREEARKEYNGHLYRPEEWYDHQPITITEIRGEWKGLYRIHGEDVNGSPRVILLWSNGTAYHRSMKFKEALFALLHKHHVKSSSPVMSNSVFDSYSGPAKENWALGERFTVCVACGKEKR